MNKKEIRKQYKQIVEALSFERKTEAKERLFELLQKELIGYKRVLSFISRNDEVDLTEVNQWLGSEKRLCLEYHEEFDCILVPGVAFDEGGVRVGRGAGFYDKLLAKYPFAYTIGICFREQVSAESLPKEDHDQLVKKICAV